LETLLAPQFFGQHDSPSNLESGYPPWGDIFESSKLQARKSLLPRFSENRLSSFELSALKQHSKLSPKRLVAPPRVYVCISMDSAGPAWSSLTHSWFWEACKRHLYVPLPGTLACAAPRQYGVDSRVSLTSTVRFTSWSDTFWARGLS